MNEGYVLSDREYSVACELSQNGNIEELETFLQETVKNKRVGPQTFASDPACLDVLRRVSPFSLAARFGRVEAVKFFLQQFPHSIELNPGASEYREDPRLRKELRHDLPLYWACLNGQLEVAKLLVSAGAMVDLPNCMQASPLQAAASNGHVAVMEFLVGKGADVNATDMFGYSPLLTAVSGGHLKAIKYLLGKHADVTQRTFEGYSIMHIAATRGHLRIVKFLLSHHVSPMFGEASPSKQGYIPCPLFLASINGRKDVAEELISLRSCTNACKSDAFVLLGIGVLKDRILNALKTFYWTKGVDMRRKHRLSPHFVTVPSFGDETEFDSVIDIAQVYPHSSKMPYQFVIIMERCLGRGSQVTAESLLGLPGDRIEIPYLCLGTRERQNAVCRVLETMICTWQKESEQSVYRHPSTMQPILEHFLEGLTSHQSDLHHVGIGIGLRALGVLQKVHTVHKCEGDSLQGVLSSLLYLFAIWLHQNCSQAQMDERGTNRDTHIGALDCEEWGKKLVAEYLYMAEGTTLLHMALTDNKLVRSVVSYFSFQNSTRNVDISQLIQALLRWGADAAINVADWNRQRPIHLAVKLIQKQVSSSSIIPQDVITPLVRAGAHLDYVNRDGKTPLDIYTAGSVVTENFKELLTTPGPVSLVCQACITIGAEKLPYLELDIPPHIKVMIRDHDRRTS